MPALERAVVEGRVNVLNVGTRILLKDVMDQYLRTLGDIVTHFAPTISVALRMFKENQIHVVVSEIEVSDGSVFRLHNELGGTSAADDDLYFILALEEKNEASLALVEELECQAYLVKPFTSGDLRALMESYASRKEIPKQPWQLMVRAAQNMVREHRYSDAEVQYKDAITSDPTNPMPMLRAAEYYLSKSKYAVADVLLNKAVEVKPSFIQGYNTLGMSHLARKDLELADLYLRKAHRLSPLNPYREFALSRIGVERSIESCKAAVRLDSSNAMAGFLLGKLLTLQKDYVGAIRELEKAMPNLRDATRNEAQVFIALSKKLGGLANTK